MQRTFQQHLFNQSYLLQCSNNLSNPSLYPLLLNIQLSNIKQQRVLQFLFEQQQKAQMLNLITQQARMIPLSLQIQQNNISADLVHKEPHFEEQATEKFAEIMTPSLDKIDASVTTANSKEDLDQYEPPLDSVESSTDNEDADQEEFKITRRNGFKGQKRSSEDLDSLYQGQRKSNKFITPKKPPSKAKHLWINYGRKILEFALTQLQGEAQAKVKLLVGKLGSKKDFRDVFEVKDSDSEEDKSFKVLFGKIALSFVKTKVDEAFEDSKYKDQMVAQKYAVAFLISKSIGC